MDKGILKTQYKDLGEVKIAYREAGRGPALILLHGNSESKAIFSKYQLEHFRDFHTLALDSRGHGETLSQDERYSIGQYADDVIAFCKVKGIQQAFVIGYSDGGNIALFLAKKAPDLFPRIVAISPNYLASGTVDGWLRTFQAMAGVLRFLGKVGFSTRKALLRFDLMLSDIGITAQELGTIRTRVHILYAEKDMIKEEHIREMGGLIPGATLRKIGRCNHMTILGKDETVADIKEYFLGEGE
jgi:pimeloyl-ACP methyl ester carboxylesterase